MRTIINTDSDSELSIQICETSVTNNNGTYRIGDQLCIMIEGTKDDKLVTAISFLTKHQMKIFAQKLLDIAKEM